MSPNQGEKSVMYRSLQPNPDTEVPEVREIQPQLTIWFLLGPLVSKKLSEIMWFGTRSMDVGVTRAPLNPNSVTYLLASFKQVILASSSVLCNLGLLQGSGPIAGEGHFAHPC